jgi:SAM-dependent methyltransferase
LDIGCDAGFFSFKMKERNASRVVSIDSQPHVLAQARFLSQWFETSLELYELDAYSVDQLETRFDVIVFLGLFCRLKHPFHALEKAAAICDATMYFQTVLRGDTADFEPREDYPLSETEVFNQSNYPRMFFIEKSISGDASNWWFPTRSCVKAMLRVAGFDTIVDTDNPEILICSIPPRPPESTTGVNNGEADIAKVKELWGGPTTWDGHNGMVCWMQHPKVQERLNLLASGDPHKNRFLYFEEKYSPRLPVERVITLGCGHGELERGLAPHRFTLHHDAIDISEGAISEAIRLAEAAGLSHIHYEVGDLNTIDLPAGVYDVVFAISSIHHTAKLERLFEQISRSLKPGGYFFADEFIGPTQFQWTALQLKEINKALAAMPAQFRRCVDSRKGMKSPVMRLTIEEMNRIDPSEAVRSAEILPLMSQVFDLVEVKGCGGSLLHMLLEDIAGNFSTDDPAAMAHLESLFKLEDDLIQTGALQHDFAVIIARKKASAP